MRDALAIRQTAVRQNDRELIAAEPRADVTHAHLEVDASGGFTQQRVASEMAVLIVDALEVIDVDHQAGDGLAEPLGPRELFAQARVEVTSIVEAGEEVRE